MQDIRHMRMERVGKECTDDEKGYKQMRDRAKIQDKTMFNMKKQFEQDNAFKRINDPKKLKPFGDYDKDGIPNVVDYRPFKKNKNRGFLL